MKKLDHEKKGERRLENMMKSIQRHVPFCCLSMDGGSSRFARWKKEDVMGFYNKDESIYYIYGLNCFKHKKKLRLRLDFLHKNYIHI